MRETTVADLVAQLGEYPDDAVVRIATQPSYPLQHTLDGVADLRDAQGLAEPDSEPVVDGVVWLIAGSHPETDPDGKTASPYANRVLWDAAQLDPLDR